MEALCFWLVCQCLPVCAWARLYCHIVYCWYLWWFTTVQGEDAASEEGAETARQSWAGWPESWGASRTHEAMPHQDRWSHQWSAGDHWQGSGSERLAQVCLTIIASQLYRRMTAVLNCRVYLYEGFHRCAGLGWSWTCIAVKTRNAVPVSGLYCMLTDGLHLVWYYITQQYSI